MASLEKYARENPAVVWDYFLYEDESTLNRISNRSGVDSEEVRSKLDREFLVDNTDLAVEKGENPYKKHSDS